MIIDNRTPAHNWPLPDAGNYLKDDLERLKQALLSIDNDLAALDNIVTGKTDVSSLDAYQALAAKNQANGYAGLNAAGQLPDQLLPNSIMGGLSYKGPWNAQLNLPPLPAAAPANKGWYYIIDIAGTTTVNGVNDWQAGDWIVSNGAAWSKIDNTDRVSSVAGRTGAVILERSDISDLPSFLTPNTIEDMRLTLGLGSAALVNSDYLPAVGDLVFTFRDNAPPGTIKANGAHLSRTAYAELFNVFGTRYGGGDGINTFAIPDLRGEFIRGWDDGRGIDPNRVLGSWQADVFKAHSHPQSDRIGSSSGGNVVGKGPCKIDHPDTTTSTKETGGSETRPRNIAALICIRYKGVI